MRSGSLRRPFVVTVSAMALAACDTHSTSLPEYEGGRPEGGDAQSTWPNEFEPCDAAPFVGLGMPGSLECLGGVWCSVNNNPPPPERGACSPPRALGAPCTSGCGYDCAGMRAYTVCSEGKTCGILPATCVAAGGSACTVSVPAPGSACAVVMGPCAWTCDGRDPSDGGVDPGGERITATCVDGGWQIANGCGRDAGAD